jgi:ABC-type branched-subunit amino acid transport system ATPase component
MKIERGSPTAEQLAIDGLSLPRTEVKQGIEIIPKGRSTVEAMATKRNLGLGNELSSYDYFLSS